MSKYICPYCNPKYQFISQTNKGKLICGLCGEEVVKKSYISFRQIISLIIMFTFIFPLLYTFVISLINKKDFKKENHQGYNIQLIKDIIKVQGEKNLISKKVFI